MKRFTALIASAVLSATLVVNAHAAAIDELIEVVMQRTETVCPKIPDEIACREDFGKVLALALAIKGKVARADEAAYKKRDFKLVEKLMVEVDADFIQMAKDIQGVGTKYGKK